MSSVVDSSDFLLDKTIFTVDISEQAVPATLSLSSCWSLYIQGFYATDSANANRLPRVSYTTVHSNYDNYLCGITLRLRETFIVAQQGAQLRLQATMEILEDNQVGRRQSLGHLDLQGGRASFTGRTVYLDPETLQYRASEIRVCVGQTLERQGVSSLTNTSINRTFLRMISGEKFLDTKFILYTRRRVISSDGIASVIFEQPKPIYANSSLLIPTCDYFSALLSPNGFSESEEGDLTSSPQPAGQIENYDYESDSDLEEGEDSNESKEITDTVQGTGKVIFIKDFAYNTWRVFLFYIYTGELKFSSLQSRSPVEKSTNSDEEEALPEASPKSIYRLADKLGLEVLADKALADIKSQLTVDNIIHELFTVFTSWFPKILEMELGFLFSNWDEIRNSPSLEEKMAQFSRSELPHALPVVLAIIRGRN